MSETKGVKKEIKVKKENKIIKTVLNIVFWVIIVGLMAVWVVDFSRVKSSKEPIFCLAKKTHTFNDGNVVECKGLGYKVYTYDRSSMSKAVQFSPFFVKMKK